MAVEAQTRPSEDRLWLSPALLVLIDPRPVFAALRDDSEDAARARQEPILAIVGLAGIASILWTSVAGRVMDDPAFDGLVVAVWAFIGGAFYGLFGYFAVGAPLYGGVPFAAWAVALLVVGTRTLHAWSWPRTLEGVGLAVVIPALVAAAVYVL